MSNDQTLQIIASVFGFIFLLFTCVFTKTMCDEENSCCGIETWTGRAKRLDLETRQKNQDALKNKISESKNEDEDKFHHKISESKTEDPQVQV